MDDFRGNQAVLEFSNIGLEFSIPTQIASRTVSGTIPEDISCREAIRMLAQAARCACYINRDGILVFFDPLEVRETVDILDFNNMASMPKITVGAKINIVELTTLHGDNEFVYTASDIGVDEPVRVASYNNPLVLEVYGDIVSDWLLQLCQRRFTYKLQERGNPARDISDFATVHDPYGGVHPVVVTRQKLDFDGGLKGETDGIGVV